MLFHRTVFIKINLAVDVFACEKSFYILKTEKKYLVVTK